MFWTGSHTSPKLVLSFNPPTHSVLCAGAVGHRRYLVANIKLTALESLWSSLDVHLPSLVSTGVACFSSRCPETPPSTPVLTQHSTEVTPGSHCSCFSLTAWNVLPLQLRACFCLIRSARPSTLRNMFMSRPYLHGLDCKNTSLVRTSLTILSYVKKKIKIIIIIKTATFPGTSRLDFCLFFYL